MMKPVENWQIGQRIHSSDQRRKAHLFSTLTVQDKNRNRTPARPAPGLLAEGEIGELSTFSWSNQPSNSGHADEGSFDWSMLQSKVAVNWKLSIKLIHLVVPAKVPLFFFSRTLSGPAAHCENCSIGTCYLSVFSSMDVPPQNLLWQSWKHFIM